jgi:hypothetical protein
MTLKAKMRSIGLSVVAAALLSLTFAPALRAQSRDDRVRQASFTAGASFGDGEAAPALSTGMRFGLSERVGLEIEFAHTRTLDFTLDLCPAPLVCVRGGKLPVTGRTISLIPHVVIQLLPVSRRIRAYALAGAGAGHVRQRYFTTPPTDRGEGGVELTRSSLTLAISFGGGASVPVSRRFAVGVDVRSLHLFDNEATIGQFITPAGTLSTLRVGSRVSYEF